MTKYNKFIHIIYMACLLLLDFSCVHSEFRELHVSLVDATAAGNKLDDVTFKYVVTRNDPFFEGLSASYTDQGFKKHFYELADPRSKILILYAIGGNRVNTTIRLGIENKMPEALVLDPHSIQLLKDEVGVTHGRQTRSYGDQKDGEYFSVDQSIASGEKTVLNLNFETLVVNDSRLKITLTWPQYSETYVFRLSNSK